MKQHYTPRPVSERFSGSESALRVLHVVPGLTTGGAEAVLYRLVTSGSGTRHEVICLEQRAWYSAKLEEHGIKVHHVKWGVAGFIPAVWRLHRLIRSIDADVVQTWMYRANLFGGLSARLAGKPVVWNVRTSTLDLYPVMTRLLAYAGGIGAGWIPERIINCSTVSSELHAKLGYASAQGIIIPNGYDPEVFRPDDSARAEIRDELALDRRRFIIGTIGRWDPNKGYPLLVQALRLLRDRGIVPLLLMVGRGLDWKNRELRHLITENGCEEQVRLAGERVDIPEVARAMDLHVLSSLSEGFPNVVSETMLAGVPNVVTDVGDAALIAGETGWVVAPGDASLLADAIERAHSEWGQPEWEARRARARQRVAERFRIDGMVQSYEKVWADVAATGKRRAAPMQPSPRKAASLQQAASRPLRILHIINRLTLGGAEALLYRVATRDRTNEHVVVSIGGPAWYSRLLEEKGVSVHHLGVDSPSELPSGLLRLRRVVRDSAADVVQCWMYHSNVFGGLVAKVEGKPVIWSIHNNSLEPVRLRSRAIVYFGGLIAGWIPDFVLNCSNRSAELHGKLGYSAAEGTVVHNGYDPSIWFPDEQSRRAARESLEIGPREFAIGSVARWDALKDIPNLISALGIVKDRGIPFRCVLIGAGLNSRNEQLANEIRRSRCEDRLLLLGSRSDLQELARALDLHVLASRTEAFPNVVAETMLSGTPNAVSDVGDSAMMVGNTGWIVPARDPEALADAIVAAYEEWKSKPADWEVRRGLARKQIIDNFSFERMIKTYRAIWSTVASGRTRQSSLKPIAVQ